MGSEAPAPGLRAVLVGAGRIAREHLGCLEAMDGARTVAVCDRSPAVAELAAERFGVPRWFTDHRDMLRSVEADVVHVTTPPGSHLPIALDALAAGCHVIVEKPAAPTFADVTRLLEAARAAGRHVVESHNYLFNEPVRRLLALRDAGELGDVVHVDVAIALDVHSPGGAFADPHVPHPALALRGGAIADFLPHLASLALAFTGPHRAVHAIWRKREPGSPLPADELRALVDAEQATAVLSFSSHAGPDAFTLRVEGTRMRAEAGLFEPRLIVERVRGGPRPLQPTVNGLAGAGAAAGAALAGLARKLAPGPRGYEGLWALVEASYAAFAAGGPPPVDAEAVAAVHHLIDDLVASAPAA